ncbi:bifunctional 2-polyprenyl-6-hydroxyphenol methylase/3-demethylubiquinol 3-O-methyltransferase UbiG [Pseudoruegeria sp. HB172150]|uniref:class I SAM-dependent methyltransferase n=1 Tax=Pseudoruegeria sp. HB172150 TaxID=2721164 RepID=UPI0020A6689D|nr:class I SAM-dependent methyltransferase [Pseudoruegeria sp. HB172150]
MTEQDSSWNMWDDRYDREDYLFGTAPAEFVRTHAQRIPSGSRVLAVADGEGRNSVFLARQGLNVTAMDNSRRGLEKARALAEDAAANVDFKYGDISDWDWAAKPYDALVAVFIQFADPALRTEIFRGFDIALRPGGLLLLHGFAPRQVEYGTGGPPHRENMYTLDMLEETFPGYRVLHSADYDADQTSGEGHSGVAGLIDFVAEKPGG